LPGMPSLRSIFKAIMNGCMRLFREKPAKNGRSHR
jgi:hypothetical protein